MTKRHFDRVVEKLRKDQAEQSQEQAQRSQRQADEFSQIKDQNRTLLETVGLLRRKIEELSHIMPTASTSAHEPLNIAPPRRSIDLDEDGFSSDHGSHDDDADFAEVDDEIETSDVVGFCTLG